MGIIGVVAALTMPALIASSKKSERTARLKKFNSVMSQAILMAQNDIGPVEDWGLDASDMDLEIFFQTYFAPYLKYVSASHTSPEGTTSSVYYYVYLADGSYFYLFKGTCVDVVFDINGKKIPNKEGYDRFRFLICGVGARPWCNNGKKSWCSYYRSPDDTRDKRLSECQSSGYYCSGLLEFDNWEFKDDYPYRIK